MRLLAWRPRSLHTPSRHGTAADVPGRYAGRVRFRPRHRDRLPPVLINAIGREVEVAFAGTAEAGDPFAGQRLYLEWRSDDVLDGFLIPEEDLEFLGSQRPRTSVLCEFPTGRIAQPTENVQETENR
jgi:hypothetical protein